MLILRNFTNKDIEILQKNKYPNEEVESIQHKIELWNSKECDGKYYEIFAVLDDDMIVGMAKVTKAATLDFSINKIPPTILIAKV